MKNKVRILVLIAVALFLLWNMGSLLLGRNASEMVQYGVMEDAFHTSLYLFKDEVVIEGTDGGILRPVVADGERVHKGSTIGAVLSSDTDESALYEHLRIQERIERLRQKENKEGTGETVRTDEMISNLSVEITRAAEHGDMERVTILKDELMIAKDEKSAASGQKQALLDLLEERKNALSSGIGDRIKEVYSPRAGILLLQTDGLENAMTVEKAEGLSPAKLAELAEGTEGVQGNCKILYSNVWKGACVVDAETAGRLKVGQVVSLRIDACDDPVEKAEICEISPEEEGKCVVVFSSNRTPEGLMSCRKVSADVVIRRYEGLRVPRKAFVEENGETGVYVQTVTQQVFRKAEIAYESDPYVIVREGENTSLKLYDTVVY